MEAFSVERCATKWDICTTCDFFYFRPCSFTFYI